MKLINTKLHGLADYLLGILLVACPWLFNFRDKSAQTLLPISAGALLIIYSMFTKYESSLFKGLQMKAHLLLDVMLGGLLAVSPWLFRFNEVVYGPHLLIGTLMVASAVLSDTVTSKDRQTKIRRQRSSSHLHSSAWMGHTE